MRRRFLHLLRQLMPRRLVRRAPERRLCGFERRRIISMIDAGESYRTIIRQHGFTRAEVDRALLAQTGGRSDS